MKSLKGKRLLILGGSMWKDAIRKYAEEHNVKISESGNSDLDSPKEDDDLNRYLNDYKERGHK